MFSMLGRAILALPILSLPLVHAQFVSSLPQCVQDCINSSQDNNCQATDIKCLCRASAGNFLPDVITCMHGSCDNVLDNNLLLTPLQLACQLAGTPIPAAALRNAENEASSLAFQATTTVTVGGSSATGGAAATTTVAAGTSLTTVTVTTTQSGTTIYEIYPITIDSTTTVSGPTSTVTVSNSPSLVPVLVTTTNSLGSTYTILVSGSGTTLGSTVTIRTSSILTTTASPQSSSSTGAMGAAASSDTTTTTSVAAQETSSSPSASNKGSKTSKAPSPDESNSAPFKDTNSGGVRSRDGVSGWMWISLLLGAWWVWI